MAAAFPDIICLTSILTSSFLTTPYLTMLVLHDGKDLGS